MQSVCAQKGITSRNIHISNEKRVLRYDLFAVIQALSSPQREACDSGCILRFVSLSFCQLLSLGSLTSNQMLEYNSVKTQDQPCAFGSIAFSCPLFVHLHHLDSAERLPLCGGSIADVTPTHRLFTSVENKPAPPAKCG